MSGDELGALLVIAGTFLPILGVGATLLAAAILPGIWRWAVLFAGPAVTAALCSAIAEPVMRDGNMLAAITFILLFVFLWIYYPVLTIVAAVVWFRKRRSDRPAA